MGKAPIQLKVHPILAVGTVQEQLKEENTSKDGAAEEGVFGAAKLGNEDVYVVVD